MHMQRDLHPTVLSSLEGIVDQMVWFRENWYEEVLRQLRQGLAKCYVIAFDNRQGVQVRLMACYGSQVKSSFNKVTFSHPFNVN